ncbi:hypothetical protein [Micromonospora sp. NPDC023633]|uniref:alpha/beta fold hydrolase n=1 Tax=Micromonospora sp. NPDC023633 TaxID=3154320 RepID=UPI0033FCFB98
MHVDMERFFVYLHDFGAPVGYHLATRAPTRIRGLIVQSGNAHEDGLGEQWDSARAYWADPTDEVLAYHRALERMDAHIYDGGHLLAETHAAECAELMRAFVRDNA